MSVAKCGPECLKKLFITCRETNIKHFNIGKGFNQLTPFILTINVMWIK